MANYGTLADSFLEDLEEMDEKSEEDEKTVDEEDEEENSLENDLDDLMEEEDNLDAVLNQMASVKGICNIAQLRASLRFQKHMSDISDSLSGKLEPSAGLLEDNPEYKLLVASNSMIHEIDDEINNIYRYVIELYAKKFPELESLIPNKIDYIRTIQRIGNEMDMTLVELNDLLPSASVMVVSVTGSTTSGQPLNVTDLEECQKGCEEVLLLNDDKLTILNYVESRMNDIAPNLCALTGSRVAAQLVGLAGGYELIQDTRL